MKMKTVTLALVSLVILCASAVSAAPLPAWGDEIDVIGYDLLDTLALGARSGASYAGSTAYPSTGVYDYTGSSGSLNNGVTTEGISGGQTLFRDDLGTSIILHLPEDNLYNITAIYISGGNPSHGFFGNDTYTGALGGLRVGAVEGEGTNVVRGTVQPALAAPDSPWVNNQREPVDDIIILQPALTETETRTLILDNFYSNTDNSFAFAEIQVFGSIFVPEEPDPNPEPVPEPSTVALLGVGLLGVLGLARRRQG